MTDPLFTADHPSPETALWRAVLFQAIRDATEPPTSTRQLTPAEREGFTRQARAYFTLGNPDFRETCTLAAVDPMQVCTLVSGLIASGSTLPTTNRVVRHDTSPSRKRSTAPRRATSRPAPADRTPDERERARTYAREYARKRRAQLVQKLGIEEVRRREREAARLYRGNGKAGQ